MKKVRKDIHAIFSALQDLPKSREMALAITKLEEAKMWAGQILALQGEETPYANDGNRKIKNDIEKETDVPEFGDYLFTEETTLIEKIDVLREEISKIKYGKYIVDFINIMEKKAIEKEERSSIQLELLPSATAITSFVSKITEARMWLGKELGRIRDKAK